MEAFENWLAETAVPVRRPGGPLVSLCYAQSLDGCLAMQRGRATALSGPASSRMTHRLRAAHDAILVGVGTILSDNPLLTVRLVEGKHPQPVILDSQLRTPPQARVLHKHPRPAWIATRSPVDPARSQALSAQGARILPLPSSKDQRIDLASLLDCLAEQGIRRLMVEGGARVLTSFLAQGLVDRVIITVAPVYLAGLASIEPGALAAKVGRPPRLSQPAFERLGDDLIIYGQLESP